MPDTRLTDGAAKSADMDTSATFIKQKGGELFPGKHARCTAAKTALTKAMKSFQKSVDEFINSKDQPTLTRQRKANQMMEWSNKLEKRLENLTKYMEDFTDYCMSLGEEDFKKPATPSSVIDSANASLEEREREVNSKLAEHEEVLRQAEQVLSLVPAQQQVVEKKDEPRAFATFKQQADLKPALLEREASFAEAKHFTEIFTNYIENGYGGGAKVPREMVAVQLQPFVCEIWWSQMVQLDIKSKNLKEAMDVVMAVASENNPVHGRRMDLLKMRRGSQDHSQWLHKLEAAMELTKWEEWNKESMIVHLFL